jgi:ribosomal protein L16 Arg81 hydroxylase
MALYDPTEADEKRDERLAELTREAADGITQALAAGLPKTVQQIDEAFGEFIQDSQALAKLLQRTAAGENTFAEVVKDLIWNEALVRAEQELQRLEREGAEAADDARIDLMLWHREPA